MILARFDFVAFLRDHWQGGPLVIRDPWDTWANPLDPDDLAGLAGDEDVESRLIVRSGDAYALEHGPVPAGRFAALPDRDWTLLVQAVDHAVPAVAALLDAFAFLPNWRIDDVMVSYAADGGGVGPHFDAYDVFLIQGLGQRRWRVGPRCDATTPLRPHADLRLLEGFAATDEWLLGPGDILYVPPGFAHDGVATGSDCMTYSVGFRAPSAADLIGGFADALLEEPDDARFADPGRAPTAHPGAIAAADLDRLHAMVTAAAGDRAAFARWFGTHASTRKYPDLDWTPAAPTDAAALRARLARRPGLARNPASRFVFVEDGASVTLFVDGAAFECTGEAATLAKALCAGPRLRVTPAWRRSDSALAVLVALVDTGSIVLD